MLDLFMTLEALYLLAFLPVLIMLVKIYRVKQETLENQAETIRTLVSRVGELKSQKRSLETIYGNAVENLIPFIDEFKDLDPKEFRQLGKPIDYIYFGEDKIIIMEVKSGNAKLNAAQRHIRDLIRDGKVEFKEVRIKR